MQNINRAANFFNLIILNIAISVTFLSNAAQKNNEIRDEYSMKHQDYEKLFCKESASLYKKIRDLQNRDKSSQYTSKKKELINLQQQNRKSYFIKQDYKRLSHKELEELYKQIRELQNKYKSQQYTYGKQNLTNLKKKQNRKRYFTTDLVDSDHRDSQNKQTISKHVVSQQYKKKLDNHNTKKITRRSKLKNNEIVHNTGRIVNNNHIKKIKSIKRTIKALKQNKQEQNVKLI